MKKNSEIVFGYWNLKGSPRKYCKLLVRISAENILEQLVIIQQGMPNQHYTAHLTGKGSSPPRYARYA
jgi:hypothetical protein